MSSRENQIENEPKKDLIDDDEEDEAEGQR